MDYKPRPNKSWEQKGNDAACPEMKTKKRSKGLKGNK